MNVPADQETALERKRALSFPLRLCPSVRQQATELASRDGISLNHFISLAVAEKIIRMEHEAWVRQQNKPRVPGMPLTAPPRPPYGSHFGKS